MLERFASLGPEQRNLCQILHLLDPQKGQAFEGPPAGLSNLRLYAELHIGMYLRT